MTRYCVNATKTVPAWIYIDADSPEDAMTEAGCRNAHEWETDDFGGDIEFNVSPAVEVAP